MTPYQLETADGSDTLYSDEFEQMFHSKHGALTETKQVFVEGSGVGEQLRQGQPTNILEVGFGTGLNFFVTAELALQTGTPLHYVALEKALLPAATLQTLNHHQLLDEGRNIRNNYLSWREAVANDLSQQLTWEASDNITLELIIGDATQCNIPERTYHAIYHDAFAPDSNPDLWTEAMFKRLFDVLAEDGRLATYSVKGTVRRTLASVGFTPVKRPGPSGKREVLVALKAKSTTT